MKFISNFLFKACFFITILGLAQNNQKPDSISKFPERYGLRFGLDISKLVRTAFDKNYKGLELVADYRFSKKIYFATEIGNENKTTNDTYLNFNTQGSYIKVGFDSNSYQNWLNMENLIHVGLRYGFSTFSQNLNSYKVYNTNTFFPESPVVNNNIKYNGLSAQWIEIATGMKAKVINNIFMGFSFRINYLLSEKQPDNFANLYIPGFNRTYDGKFGVGFNYTVSYFLPLYKKKFKSKKIETKKLEKKEAKL